MRKAVRKLPTLSNHFYYREEVSDPGVSDGGIPTLVETDVSQTSFFVSLIIVKTTENGVG